MNIIELFILVIPVPNEFYVSNIFKPDMYNEPLKIVLLFNVVKPDAFNDVNKVVLLFNIVKPLTFNDDDIEVLLLTNKLF